MSEQNNMDAERAAFEAWADAGLLSRCGEEYENPYVESAWNGFNAALDAVEIDLPRGTPRSEKIRQDRNRAIDDCRAAITATGLGLKVKP